MTRTCRGCHGRGGSIVDESNSLQSESPKVQFSPTVQKSKSLRPTCPKVQKSRKHGLWTLDMTCRPVDFGRTSGLFLDFRLENLGLLDFGTFRLVVCYAESTTSYLKLSFPASKTWHVICFTYVVLRTKNLHSNNHAHLPPPPPPDPPISKT